MKFGTIRSFWIIIGDKGRFDSIKISHELMTFNSITSGSNGRWIARSNSITKIDK